MSDWRPHSPGDPVYRVYECTCPPPRRITASGLIFGPYDVRVMERDPECEIHSNPKLMEMVR